jgi:hypothetical protein
VTACDEINPVLKTTTKKEESETELPFPNVDHLFFIRSDLFSS